MTELELLENEVDSYILEDEYGRAIEVQRKVIALTKANVHYEHIRLFHLLLSVSRIEEAITEGVLSAHLCIEMIDLPRALFLYETILTLILTYHKNRKTNVDLVVSLCYELCLCRLVEEKDEIMDTLATQFPCFSESIQYKRLKERDYDLLKDEEPSQCQRNLLALIKHG